MNICSSYRRQNQVQTWALFLPVFEGHVDDQKSQSSQSHPEVSAQSVQQTPGEPHHLQKSVSLWVYEYLSLGFIDLTGKRPNICTTFL